MPRTARIVIPNYPHHVTQRGGRSQRTFFEDHDYRFYGDLLSAGKAAAKVSIWAYCLMPNHVHLIVVPGEQDSLARFFREVHRKYTRAINRRFGWQGHLWQERFHSLAMDEPHLLAAVRYVELNPVKAGLCKTPAQWAWSSARAHLAGTCDGLVDVEPMLSKVPNWSDYLANPEDVEAVDRIKKNMRAGRPLGDERFISRLEDIVKRRLRPRKRGPDSASPADEYPW